jgi:hypothetical protein
MDNDITNTLIILNKITYNIFFAIIIKKIVKVFYNKHNKYMLYNTGFNV